MIPMMLWLELILVGGAVVLALPAGVFLVQCLLAQLPARRIEPPAEMSRPAYAVLVPAHDEEVVIARTLRAIQEQLDDKGRLIVVADNCRDQTARIAASCGAEVIERQDAQRPGKGWALDAGVRHAAATGAEVIVFIDADCVPSPGSVTRLASLAAATNRPIQAVNLIDAHPKARPRDHVAAFAFLVKNLVRLRGMDRIGLPSHLTGTGMAASISVLRKVNLAHGEILEDINLGLDLLRAGHPPRFSCTEEVRSPMPFADRILHGQRKRWDHGGLLLLKQAPGMAWLGLRRLDPRILGMAFDLIVPPIALLWMLSSVLLALTLGYAIPTSEWKLILPAASVWLAIAFGAGVSWLRFGRSTLPLKGLLAAPVYALWKIPIYLAFVVQPHRIWNRTEREAL